MADKKKMSVADILATARKTDGGEGGPQADPPPEEGAAPAPSEPAAADAPAAADSAPAAKPGQKPSVADMLKMARAQGAGAKPAPSAEKTPAAKPKLAAKPAAKAAAKAKPAPAKAPAAAKDTASILAAAHKSDRRGPMSKAEAAAQADQKEGAAAKRSAAAPKREVPPMPVKPAYAKPQPAKAKAGVDEERRGVLSKMLGTAIGIGYSSLALTTGLWTLATARFMYPNILIEPPSRFKVGFPDDFPPGMVEEKFKAKFEVWVVNTLYKGQPQIFALKTVCTHLGCTPNWLDAEQKFKCPCHGSGFYKDGINFEGPAPRPLERYAISLASDGQLEIDKSQIFQEEMGQWSNSESFVSV